MENSLSKSFSVSFARSLRGKMRWAPADGALGSQVGVDGDFTVSDSLGASGERVVTGILSGSNARALRADVLMYLGRA